MALFFLRAVRRVTRSGARRYQRASHHAMQHVTYDTRIARRYHVVAATARWAQALVGAAGAETVPQARQQPAMPQQAPYGARSARDATYSPSALLRYAYAIRLRHFFYAAEKPRGVRRR